MSKQTAHKGQAPIRFEKKRKGLREKKRDKAAKEKLKRRLARLNKHTI